MGALTVGGRLPPIENELVVSRQPVIGSGDQPAATISSPYMHLSECFTGGHPPPPLSGGHPPPPLASAAAPPPISRHSPDYQVGLSPLPSTSSHYCAMIKILIWSQMQMMKPVFQRFCIFRIPRSTYLTLPSPVGMTPSSSPPPQQPKPSPRQSSQPPRTLSNRPLVPLHTWAWLALKSPLHLAG